MVSRFHILLTMASAGLLGGCVSDGAPSQPQPSLNNPVLACPGQLSRAQRIAIDLKNRSADSSTDEIRPSCR